jgi:hypothetical protein
MNNLKHATRRRRWAASSLILLAVGLGVTVAAASAGASSGNPPPVAAGPASGFVPSRNANHQKPQNGHGVSQLLYNGGPVQSSATQVQPIYWGVAWNGGNGTFSGDKTTGLHTLYGGLGGTSYAHTNSEYTGGGLAVDTLHISVANNNLYDGTNAPSRAPSTTDVLNEVVKAVGGAGNLVSNAYYPVYSDQPRGSAGYCAWHSAGTVGTTHVRFAFFFNLDRDPGCDPQASGTGHSQGLDALANVSGHEISEMLTDPELNAWFDRQGSENADKCAWTWNGNVSIGGQSWKIQGNWSNLAGSTGSGYTNGGCIQTS